jgi:hypothetical protein
MPRVNRQTQEFYCGECKGYFMVTLNIALNHEVEVVCPGPNCGHEHRRCVVDGQILENGRFSSNSKEKLRPSSASYSKEPLTAKMQAAAKNNGGSGYCGQRRDGSVLSPAMMDRWLEVAAREKGIVSGDNNEITD